jgi:thioredoxin reductase
MAVGNGGRARYDVVVVGGGAAGLSGALALARARRSVLVIDSGDPRNAPADHIHNYLGREGTPPLELLEIGRGEVAGYGGEVVAGRVSGIERLPDDGFLVTRADGPAVEARRVLVTTGLTDELPDVPGLADRWGIDVLHCPYCHGWEVQDRAIAIIGSSPLSVHQALLWRQWTADVTLILHGAPEPAGEEAAQLAAIGVDVVPGPAAAVELADGHVAGVRLGDGRLIPCDAIVVTPRFTAKADLLVGLGLPIADLVMDDVVIGTHVAADPTGKTDVPGVWVAGNVANPMEQVIGAAAAGLKAGAMINFDLVAEEARAAVEAAAVTR